jgi:hypothetical protein
MSDRRALLRMKSASQTRDRYNPLTRLDFGR